VTTLGKLIRDRRIELKLSQGRLGEMVGMTQQAIAAIENGDTQEPRNLDLIAKALEMSPVRLAEFAQTRRGTDAIVTPFRVKNRKPRPGVPTTIPRIVPDLPSQAEIPVLGYAAGGNTGAFQISDATYDTVPCPPELANVPGAYAVYIFGVSMEPRYFAGERAYVHPRLPIARGDFVVVQLAQHGEAEPTEGIVKQYLSQDDKDLILHQFNPDQDIRIDAPRVRHIHKIILAGRPY